jgi:hypothetical protein
MEPRYLVGGAILQWCWRSIEQPSQWEFEIDLRGRRERRRDTGREWQGHSAPSRIAIKTLSYNTLASPIRSGQRNDSTFPFQR